MKTKSLSHFKMQLLCLCLYYVTQKRQKLGKKGAKIVLEILTLDERRER